VLLRVRKVEFLDANLQPIASVGNPNAVTNVPVGAHGRFIRVNFTGPFDQGAHKPTTANVNDANFKRHNVLVVPQPPPRFGLEYVPGTLTIEAPDTLRFDLSRESPFFEPHLGGWQKGVLRVRIFGDDDPGIPRMGIADLGGTAQDGEPIVPSGGAMSGDGTAGGEFTLVFKVS
jgi:hypothetical protein